MDFVLAGICLSFLVETSKEDEHFIFPEIQSPPKPVTPYHLLFSNKLSGECKILLAASKVKREERVRLLSYARGNSKLD
jgi:hypothetical protein